jgi:hypothetical protein
MLVTKLPPISGVLFIAVTAMGLVAFHGFSNTSFMSAMALDASACASAMYLAG